MQNKEEDIMKLIFEELAYVVKDFRKRRNDTLVIIPLYKEYEILKQHLNILKKQTFQNFDVILVLNNITDEKKVIDLCKDLRFEFGLIIAKRREDTGSAGGFATGQVYALENDYEYMILADVDCLPVDRNLIYTLYQNRNQESYVCPTILYNDEGKTILISKIGNPPFYCLFHRKIIERYGLYFLPIYIGADDVEYLERIKSAKLVIESRGTHPLIIPLTNPSKYFFYLLQGVIISKEPRRLLNYLLTALFSIPIFLIFYPRYGREAAIKFILLLLQFKYGKEAYVQFGAEYQKYIRYFSSPLLSNYMVMNIETSFHKEKRFLLSIFSYIIKVFRKDVIIERSYSGVLLNIVAMFSKSLKYKTNDSQYLEISDNSNPLMHFLKLHLFFIFFVSFIFFLIIFIGIKATKQPSTFRYGV